MNQINLMSLINWIVCLCWLYSKDEQKTNSIRDFKYKIKSIIIYILKI